MGKFKKGDRIRLRFLGDSVFGIILGEFEDQSSRQMPFYDLYEVELWSPNRADPLITVAHEDWLSLTTSQEIANAAKRGL